MYMLCKWAVSRLKMLVTGLSSWRSVFNTRPVHEELVVDIMQMGHVFLQVLLFSGVCIIPPMLHIHSLIHSSTSNAKQEVKQSNYRPGQVQRVPGG
jgi:hypothetical protein